MFIKHLPEPELSRRLADGDETAFRELFDRYHKKILAFAHNFLKDRDASLEVVQDTFLTFWMHRQKLDPDKPIAPLLFVIARRTLVDVLRKLATSQKFRQSVLQYMEIASNATEQYILANELARITEEAMCKLTRQQQEIFVMSRDMGLSYQEIGEKLHISSNTVKYHLVNAMKTLRAHLAKHDISYILFLYFFL